MSLAELRNAQRRSNEARAVRAAVLDRFTEGFNSPDLVDGFARHLLRGNQPTRATRCSIQELVHRAKRNCDAISHAYLHDHT